MANRKLKARTRKDRISVPTLAHAYAYASRSRWTTGNLIATKGGHRLECVNSAGRPRIICVSPPRS